MSHLVKVNLTSSNLIFEQLKQIVSNTFLILLRNPLLRNQPNVHAHEHGEIHTNVIYRFRKFNVTEMPGTDRHALITLENISQRLIKGKNKPTVAHLNERSIEPK